MKTDVRKFGVTIEYRIVVRAGETQLRRHVFFMRISPFVPPYLFRHDQSLLLINSFNINRLHAAICISLSRISLIFIAQILMNIDQVCATAVVETFLSVDAKLFSLLPVAVHFLVSHVVSLPLAYANISFCHQTFHQVFVVFE